MTTSTFEDVTSADEPSGLVVMKFGGTSVADPERLQAVAARLVSGPGGAAVGSSASCPPWGTRRTSCSSSPTPSPSARTRASWTCSSRSASGCRARSPPWQLIDLGHDAISLTGSQAGIVTDTVHGKAKIVEVRAGRIDEALDAGKIVLVAGFQGVSTDAR